jgi:serine-type D-Ala-D-Ala carboxypeptidase/endopeptidase (penicillin-binding protein 4)
MALKRLWRRSPTTARRVAISIALSLTPGLGLPSVEAQSSPASWRQLQPALPTSIPATAVSIWVAPLDALGQAGAPRWAWQADTPRQMASLMKLFTTGAALQQWGPAHQWHTQIGLGGPLGADGRLNGPLYWRASGDPALDASRLLTWLSRWRQAGLQHVNGPIVVDRNVFERPPHDPAAFDGQGWRPYNAGPDPLLIAHQATTLTLRLSPDGRRWTGTLWPALAGVTVDTTALRVETTSTHCGDWRARVSLQAQAQEPAAGSSAAAEPSVPLRPWVVRVGGVLPTVCGELPWPLLWQGDGPGDHAERVLRALWEQSGGTWQGRLTEGRWPADLPAWQTWSSPPLAEVVRDINKFSNNVMARQLMLSLPGAAGTTVAQGREQLASRVTNTVSACRASELSLDNGSGLSRTEGSTAQCLGQWLAHLWRSPAMPELVASLPVTAVDGTTRRWPGAAGHAHLKTGSLDGVTGVAGYVLSRSGQRHVVVVVINHPQASQARGWINALLDWVHDDTVEQTRSPRSELVGRAVEGD